MLRAQEETTATTHSIGAVVENRWTAGTYSEIASISDLTWNNVQGKPSTFPPSVHKSTHAIGGSDALTPADIGAVNKAGDTMFGILTVPSLIAKINIPSSSPPSAWPVGFVAGIVYNNGYPVTYGTIFSYKGTSGASCVQILQAWPGNDGGEAYLYIRSARDTGADVFGPWRKVWSENNDGAGSGLDADTVDGIHASSFWQANSVTVQPGNVPIGSKNNYVEGYNSQGWVLANQLTCGCSGTLRITFNLASSSSTRTVRGRIYKNGSPVGTERVTNSTSYVNYTEDIPEWNVGDVIQVYILGDPMGGFAMTNFLQVSVLRAPACY
ncbi:hypothetical protein [Caldanaerobius polysaccharolyticus]|uniref:hypothetical protein n=1 Tax=Caldanaerobius polysaccharolyticus TaxID=44256 RepID=UPI0012EC6D14|nr:hypothetical protein [Caldanaerobius polysaccharolyticus]